MTERDWVNWEEGRRRGERRTEDGSICRLGSRGRSEGSTEIISGRHTAVDLRLPFFLSFFFLLPFALSTSSPKVR